MNQRQTKILKILYKNRGYKTIGELAGKVGVSVKTVRNDIERIREALAAANAGHIEAKPHIGVRLVSYKEELGILGETDAEEREITFFIIRQLFKSDELTAQRLAQQYYLGRAQLDKIMAKAAEWFAESRILFERRRGRGLSIAASEFNRRTAMERFYSEYSDMYAEGAPRKFAPCPIVTDADFTAASAALDGMDITPAAEAISALEERWGFKFSYISAKRLLFLLALCVTRIRRGCSVSTPEPTAEMPSGQSDAQMARELCGAIADGFGVTTDSDEERFITFAVATSEISEYSSPEARHRIEVLNSDLCRFTVRTAGLAGDVCGVDLKSDRVFVRQLFLQLKVTLARLGYAVFVKNPLLSRIKSQYPDMMAAAWFLAGAFEKETGLEINEHEAGYLALLIGGAVQRHASGLRACIICDYGVGISQILREKISREIPGLTVTEVFSARDMRKIKNDTGDFVITTTPLSDYRLGRSVVTVGHMLDRDDVAKIRDEMKKIFEKRRERDKKIGAGQRLFDKELIFPRCRISGKKELLHMMCQRLEALGYVTCDFEKSVFDREESTATDIGAGLATPHGLGKFVNRSAAAFASLEKPIVWGDDEVDMVFLIAFDLESGGEIRQQAAAFYKSVVTLTEDEDKCARLRELSDAGEILKILE